MHTPGPWNVHPVFADSNTYTIWNEHDNYHDNITRETMQANARLIAAAPDLLEALKGLLENAPQPKGIKQDFSYILYREAAKKAVAKAEGKDH